MELSDIDANCYMEGSEVVVSGRRFRFPPPPPLYDYAYYLDEPRPSTSTGGQTLSGVQGKVQADWSKASDWTEKSKDWSESQIDSKPSTSGCKKRHSYTSRYGTQENLYEEITQHPDQEEELRYVHSKHIQVLNELNLSMEAMIMPDDQPTDTNPEQTCDQLLSSPATSSLDSGFSSSSTGSNSLGRPSHSLRKSRQSLWRRLHPGITPIKLDPSTANEVRSTGSWEESSRDTSRRGSCSDVDFSSGDESNRGSSLEGSSTKGVRGSKRCSWRPATSPEPGGSCPRTPATLSPTARGATSPGSRSSGGSVSMSPAGRFARWFSMKKPSHSPSQESLSQIPYKAKMPLLLEEEETLCTSRRLVAPSLPPPPPTLSPQQLKMRHIIEAIIQSENSYLSSLNRLVYDYKKPLEEMSPAILSNTKILTLFHRVPEILQCHTLFRIALAEAVNNWDRDQRIGDVFIASFSKAVVLDVYSDFINNFSLAMDLARSETVKKPALNQFFKAKQVGSHDRMSFFGLMVKPVQRFPQFILFLQDLLNNTHQGHPERMSLQLALSQLEQLAEQLNERKRESEQVQAFRLTMRMLSAKLPHAAHHHKTLLRTDDVTQLEVNQCGLISKCKSRRLLLLNDQLICVSVSHNDSTLHLPSGAQPSRLTYKWNCPITDIHVVEPVCSPTMSRLLTPTSTSSITSSSSEATDSLCIEMSHLMHDYQIISRIHDLSHNLKASYQELNSEVTRSLLDSIQRQIQRKDEQMAWLDSCCLQLNIRGKEQVLTYQMSSIQTRKHWITELRLAKLGLDPNNSPAWEMSEQDGRPITRMPLFVNAHPVYTAQPSSEVKCGCFFTSSCNKANYLWVGTWDGQASYVSVAQVVDSSLKPITQLYLGTNILTTMQHLPSTETVWIGTNDNRLLVYSVSDCERPELIKEVDVSSSIVSLRTHCNRVFVGLANGVVQSIRDRKQEDRRYEEPRRYDDPRKIYEERSNDPRKIYDERPNDPRKVYEDRNSDAHKIYEERSNDPRKVFEERDPNKIYDERANDPRRIFEGSCDPLKVYEPTDPRKIYEPSDPRKVYEPTGNVYEPDPRKAYEECKRANEECCRDSDCFDNLALDDSNCEECSDCGRAHSFRPECTDECRTVVPDDCKTLNLGDEPISALLPVNHQLFAACGRTVHIISGLTGQIQKSYTLQPEDHTGGKICHMAQSGCGLWLALENSSVLCLYHIETFKHLQDINVTNAVNRVTGNSIGSNISSLLACKGLLWAGTQSGAVLTLPLPRLGGVPTLTGKITVSYHAHSGPVTLLLPLVPANANNANQDVYGLYGRLMTPRDPPPQNTLLTLTGGKGYTNYQQCCYKSIPSPAHILLWETKI